MHEKKTASRGIIAGPGSGQLYKNIYTVQIKKVRKRCVVGNVCRQNRSSLGRRAREKGAEQIALKVCIAD